MAENFLIKTSLPQSDLIQIANGAAIDRHLDLRNLIEARLGPDAAGLFAVPLIGRDREGATVSVSWYGDYSGTVRPLATLDGAIRDDVAARLAETVQAIRSLDLSPDDRALIEAALSVSTTDDVLVVGARPVLVNWGTAPADAPAVVDGTRSNYAATIGSLLPTTAAAPAMAMAAPAATAMPGPVAQPSTPTMAGAGHPVSQERNGNRGWLPPLILAVLLALLAGWLLIPGVRLFPPQPTEVARALSDNSPDVARRINNDLQARIASLQGALDGAVCTSDGTFVLPDGRTPEGLMPPPPGEQQDAAPHEGNDSPLLPPNPERIRPPADPGAGDAQNLLEVIEARTVLILASGGNDTGMGTGFFIAPDVVATNHHVIEGSLSSGQVFVVNAAWSEPRPAEVIQYDGPFETTGGDFALLRVAQTEADQPYYNLLDDAVAVKGQAVMAAGFPFDITGDDMRFRRLLDGNGSEPPDLVVTSGIVNSQQVIADTVSVLVHSASISKGNSGGPLVDQCGRVVGMNTFISEQSYRTLNVAQSMGNLRRFLDGGSVRPGYDDQPCTPNVSPAAALAANATPDAETSEP